MKATEISPESGPAQSEGAWKLDKSVSPDPMLDDAPPNGRKALILLDYRSHPSRSICRTHTV